MFKRICSAVLLLCLMLSLCACETDILAMLLGSEPAATENRETQPEPTETEPSTEESTLATEEPSTEPVTEAPTQPATEAPTQPSQESDDSDVPYLIQIPAGYPIYKSVGYDAACVGIVELAGIYTIVEEAWDGEGNLWGRLKSGVGWISVTGLSEEYLSQPQVTAGYADENLLLHGSYLCCGDDTAEYAVAVVFYAHQTLTDVCVYGLDVADTYSLGSLLGSWYEMTPDMPLVAWLTFPGDMSAYCLSYADSSGVSHWYSVTISGRDGSVVLSEFDPA